MVEKKTTTKKATVKAPAKTPVKAAVKKPAVKTVKVAPVETQEILTTAEPIMEKRIIKDIKFDGKYISALGKRKTAAAQVRLYTNGVGGIMVNGQASDLYFESLEARAIVNSTLKLGAESYNFSIIVSGGGKLGQAEAVRHGITNALIKANPDLRPSLKAKGFTTRDARKKERKKPGLKRARRSPQWSKR
jgi:small subunit ribosomal protein S9